MERAGRHVLLVSGVVAVFVIAATVLILALGSPSRAAWDADTPEATLQAYVDATRAGDNARALSFLTEDARETREKNDFGSSYFDCGRGESMLVVGRVTRSADDTQATVEVRIESFNGSGISWDRSSWTNDVPLQRESGAWRIADAYLCL